MNMFLQRTILINFLYCQAWRPPPSHDNGPYEMLYNDSYDDTDLQTFPSQMVRQAEFMLGSEKKSQLHTADHEPMRNVEDPAVEAQAVSELQDSQETKGAWRDLFFFTTRQDVPLIVIAVICAIAGGSVNPAQSFLTGKIFDEFIQDASGRITPDELLERTHRWVLWLTCVAIGSWIFHTLQFTTFLLLGERQAKRARRQLYAALASEPISWYDRQRQGIAALLPQLETRLADMQLACSQPLGELIATVATALISLGQAFYSSWSLTLVTLATAPLMALVMGKIGGSIQTAFDRQYTSLTDAQKVSLDALSAIDTIKCFNTQDTELTKYKNHIETAAHQYVSVSHKIALQVGCLTFFAQAMFVQAFYYGGVLISRGEKTPAAVVTTFFSAIAAIQAIQGILPQLVVFEKGRSSAARLKAIVNGMTKHTDSAKNDHKLNPLDCKGAIRMEGVTFAYPALTSQQALKDVSLTFPSGQMTFVVGKSGSGKSTIGQLLVHFYAPDCGRVLLDEQDLQDLDETWIRSKITLVEQTSTLFNDSILGNILLGQPHGQQASEADIRMAVEFALLQSLVSDLPEGLNTLVGSGGASLSGGQCQRVALARARIRDTPVLVLDESTSALDKISRDLIVDAIRQWRYGKTTIVITHEVAQIGAEDYAIVMQDGRLVQEGYRKEMERVYGSPFQHFTMQNQAKTHSTHAQVNNKPDRVNQQAQHFRGILGRGRAVGRVTRRSSLLSLSRFQRFPGIPISLASLTVSPESLRNSLSYFTDTTTRVQITKDSVSTTYLDSGKDAQNAQRQSMARLEDHLLKVGQVAASCRKWHSVHQRLLPTSEDKTLPSDAIELDEHKPLAMVKEQFAGNSRSLNAILRTVWPTLHLQGRVHLLLGFWGGTIHAVGTPVFGYVLSKLMGLYAVRGDSSREQMTYSLVILALAAIDGSHFYLCRFMMERAAQAWVDRNRVEALRRLLSQPRAFFDRPENLVYPIVQELDRSGEEMRNLLGRFVGLMYIAALTILSSVIWALTTQWKMTAITLAVTPYVAVLTYFYTPRSSAPAGPAGGCTP